MVIKSIFLLCVAQLPSLIRVFGKKPQVSSRLQEAWNWLEREGLLMHSEEITSDPNFMSPTQNGTG